MLGQLWNHYNYYRIGIPHPQIYNQNELWNTVFIDFNFKWILKIASNKSLEN